MQVDGYQGYNRLTKPSRKVGSPIRVAHCWAHARRKLKEVFDRDGSEITAEGLHRIAEFYAIEADIRGISPGQRLSAHQTRAAPLVAAFGEWLQTQLARYPPNPVWEKSSPISITNGKAANRPDRWSRRDQLQQG
ncbi:IS66 family transposase [Ochrobactrum sp. EDr1-4]|uniref:IS66 family transposase n=1 Tax=Ochrobactrum sp. EDr1-4 TaxID=3368622 RepID=UPI003B9E8594